MPEKAKSVSRRRLTRAEIEAGIGWKCLVITRNIRKPDAPIVRVMSPHIPIAWERDEGTGTFVLQAHRPPTDAEGDLAGVHVAFSIGIARQYGARGRARAKLCKVKLSGVVIFHENGARGEFARLLEVCEE